MMTTTLNTAIATMEDIEALVSLLSLLFSQEVEFSADPDLQRSGVTKIIENPDIGEIVVIRDQQSIIGMCTLLYTISTALGGKVVILEDMVIDPRHRKQGVGSQLLNNAIDHAKSKGCQRITLLTDDDNLQAQKFYTRHGFSASSMRPYRQRLLL